MGTCDSALNRIEERRSFSQFSDRHRHNLSNISDTTLNHSSQNLPKTFRTYILPPNITKYDDITKKYSDMNNILITTHEGIAQIINIYFYKNYNIYNWKNFRLQTGNYKKYII